MTDHGSQRKIAIGAVLIGIMLVLAGWWQVRDGLFVYVTETTMAPYIYRGLAGRIADFEKRIQDAGTDDPQVRAKVAAGLEEIKNDVRRFKIKHVEEHAVWYPTQIFFILSIACLVIFTYTGIILITGKFYVRRYLTVSIILAGLVACSFLAGLHAPISFITQEDAKFRVLSAVYSQKEMVTPVVPPSALSSFGKLLAGLLQEYPAILIPGILISLRNFLVIAVAFFYLTRPAVKERLRQRKEGV